MKRLLSIPAPTVLLAVLAIAGLAAVAGSAPVTIVRSGSTWQVRMSQQMYQAMAQYNPHLRLLNSDHFIPSLLRNYASSRQQTPWAVLGDFNGDGHTDVACLASVGTTVVLLLATADGRGGYAIQELARSSDALNSVYEVAAGRTETGVWTFLGVQRPGVLYSPLEQVEAELRHPGVRFEYWKVSAEVFYWDAGHLRRIRILPK